MASDGVPAGRKYGARESASPFVWVSSSPSPAVIAELEDRFPDVVQVPVAALDSATVCWKETAILARSYHRWVPPEAIVREFRRAGVAGEIQSLCLAHRCYFFRFQDATARDLVLGRPWVANGQTVATEEWQEEFIPAMDSVPSALIWVRLPSLPLEFWQDEVLDAILAPAGHFQFSDPATRSLTRGGFARACVRVDLRRPLRPGVRVQGMGSPFWQQFQFENLDGICSACGSIHLSGPCSVSSPAAEAGQPHSEALFGAWMSATRQRRSSGVGTKKVLQPSGSPPSDPVPLQGSELQRGSLSSGWQVPAKAARRRPRKSAVALASAPGSRDLTVFGSRVTVVKTGGSSDNNTASFCAGSAENGKSTVLISDKVSEGAEFQFPTSKNPFELLGGDGGVCGPVVLRDCIPGPSKRARPEVSPSPRVTSGAGSRKGKGVVPISSGTMEESPSTTDLGLGSRSGNTDDREGFSGNVTLAESSMSDGHCHQLALSRLKSAIKGQHQDPSHCGEAPRLGDSAIEEQDDANLDNQMDCINQTNVGGTLDLGYLSDSAMQEDRAGPPPSS